MLSPPGASSRALFRAGAALALLGAAPVLAAQPEADKPVTDDSVSAGDVVATPADDLNLRDKALPPLLLEAAKAPYSRAGLDSCEEIAGAVGALDQVLGEDLDTAAAKKRPMDAGRVAREAVGILIPFRGLIREVSGASGSKRKLADAVIVGAVRRAYLKGLGEEMGCPYPARPADTITRQVLADIPGGVNNPAPDPPADPTAAPPAEPEPAEPSTLAQAAQPASGNE